MPEEKLVCYGCGKTAITTICQLLACAECFAKYAEEGRQYLPMSSRAFYRWFIDKARAAGNKVALTHSYEGY